MRGMVARREKGSRWKLHFYEDAQAYRVGRDLLCRAWHLLVRDVIPTLIILVVTCFVTLLFARYISEAKAVRGEVSGKGMPRIARAADLGH